MTTLLQLTYCQVPCGSFCEAALRIAIVVPVLLYAGWRGVVLVRMITVLDLGNFEEETASESLQAIPGAFVLDPSRLQRAHRSLFPMISRSLFIVLREAIR